MERRRVGLVWPEPVQDGHLAELQPFVGSELHLDVEAVESDPRPEQDITLALVEGLARDPNIGQAAQRLAERGAQAVAYGCTSGSYVLGSSGDAAIIERMRTAAGVPATTTSTAVVTALRTLGAHSVAVLSPHIDDLNARLRAYLEAAGFNVAAMVGLNLSCDIEAVEPAETRHIVESQVDTPTPTRCSSAARACGRRRSSTKWKRRWASRSSRPTRPRCGTSGSLPVAVGPLTGPWPTARGRQRGADRYSLRTIRTGCQREDAGSGDGLLPLRILG